MAGISTALSNALSGLLVSAGQTAVVSRNITRANDENYSREIASTSSSATGAARLDPTQRAADSGLLASFLQSTSNLAAQQTLLRGLTNISSTVGDVQTDGSVAWSISQFQQNLQALTNDPANSQLANQAISGAKRLSETLNSASEITQAVRNDAESGIKNSVATINDLLQQMQKVDSVIAGNSPDADARAAAMDRRDTILKSLAAEIGIQTTLRPDNSIAIYTDGGVTLYDRSPREVTFSASNGLSAGNTGAPVFADGVQITGTGAPMPSKSGNLVAYVQLRDQVAPVYQNQLDEAARFLISAFSEKDQSSAPILPDATGLFSYSGSPAAPGAGVYPGLAAQIRVNSAATLSSGGNPNLLRDGGINGPSYKYNSANTAGFQARLQSLMQTIAQKQAFNTSSQLSSPDTVLGFASASAGWVEAQRSTADQKSTDAQAMQTRTRDSLLRTTGVNLDLEMSTMLSLEKSYQASAKVLTTVDQMMGDLMQVVR